jgi:nicotinamide-nucleotide amidase
MAKVYYSLLIESLKITAVTKDEIISMNAELISIGTEILLGEITDTNSTWIARQLRDIGLNLYFITAVGDNLERITDTVKRALDRSQIVITTGGLGPTVDDMTRQAIANAGGRELVFYDELLEQIRARFEKLGVPQMTENNRQQAFAPEGAILLENPVGTAPCFILELEECAVISLPGVPREMKFMMEKRVLPYLREKMGLPAIIKARVLRTAGIGESMVDAAIGDFMTMANPTVGLAAHSGQTDIRITARAGSEEEADALIAPLEAEIRERVGQFIFGTDQDTLEEALPRFLKEQGIEIALAEAGTGGALQQALEQLYGSGLKIVETYPNVATLQAQMGIQDLPLGEVARQALKSLCSRQAVKVGMAVLYKPDGTAALAISTPHMSHGREFQLGSDEEAVRWALRWGLGYIWRYLKEGQV